MELGLQPDGTDPESGLPRYQIVITPGPLLGYGEADSGHPPLACLRCGALVVNYARHDEWHVSLGR